MIHRIFGDLPSFKSLTFRPGFNLLLADKSPGATDRQTRNAAGKTSLVELVHFLVGGSCDAKSLFRSPALAPHRFGMRFDLKGYETEVHRTGSKPARVGVSEDTETSNWPIVPRLEKSSGRCVISNNEWRTVLGNLTFGLNPRAEGEGTAKFSPTFRSLFGYFVRRQTAGAFSSPVQQVQMQQPWDWQVSISYLLGLDWTIPQQWQVIREREKELQALRKAASEGTFGAVIGTAAELRTQLTVAEEEVNKKRERVRSFRVAEDYRDLEGEASELTKLLGELADENTVDRQLIAELAEALKTEMPPPPPNLDRLYHEIGIALPSLAVRRFEEVRTFHESVIRNRQSYLAQELEAAERRVAERNEQQQALDERRSRILSILQSSGALEQYNLLQSELSAIEARTEALRQRFSAAEMLEGRKTQLGIERGQLQGRLQQDYREQGERLRAAILAFEKTSKALYEEPGSLTINPGSNGPEFGFKIQGERSKGINNMQIFCFDLMLARICAERRLGPGFLVHDSHLFDGVDERQIGKALQVGSETAKAFDFQYIVTMNSDAVPRELPDGFSLDDAIVPVRLTDATEDGGLFGMRF